MLFYGYEFEYYEVYSDGINIYNLRYKNILESDLGEFSDSGDGDLNFKPTLAELAQQVPDQYKVNFKCDKFVDEMQKLMIKNGISGEKVSIQSKTGYIWSDKYGVISENGRHYAIKVDDIVYDNLNPNGINYNDWLSDLGITDLQSMFDLIVTSID